MTCSIDHSGDIPKSIGDLERSQAGFWRHRCAGCAYLQGQKDAERLLERQRDQIRKLKERVSELEDQLAKIQA